MSSAIRLELGITSSEAQKLEALAAIERQVEVSVVMPCLNERETVGVCVRKAMTALRETGIAGEVIVADNGSTDGSIEIARAEGMCSWPTPTIAITSLIFHASWSSYALARTWRWATASAVASKTKPCPS